MTPSPHRILTPDQRLRVFVSSTLDLTEHRAAARRAIESLHLIPVMFEAAARPHPPRSLYRAYVDQSDVFVALYSTRYGWIAPGMSISGLEDEFDLSEGLPRLVYVEAGVSREPELDALLERVRESGLSYKHFSSPSELETLLAQDLVVLLTERFRAPDVRGAATGPPPSAALPIPLTPFLGRQGEVEELAALLARDDVRLLTLTGPGGIGKTRLAVEAARRIGDDFPGGVYFVSLAALRDPDLVGDSIAAALGVASSDPYPATAAIADLVHDQRTLFVLDNFEQVVDAAGVVSKLLTSSPLLKVMATSRAPLRVRGEHEFAVSPLELPSDAEAADSRRYAAIELFVESARAVRPDFELDPRALATIVAICRELDGLPLAIELAASMIRVLTPDMILTRLRERPTDLGGGLRDLPDRQRRLGDTIAWSYDLLDAPVKEYFAQLAVFRGGFTLDTAEQICAVPGSDVFSAIASLTDQSLLLTDVHAGDSARFSMLETIRRFAWERLEESAHHDEVRSRHARTFVALVHAAGRDGGRRREAMDAIEEEIDNVRAAFEWFLDHEDPDPVADAVWESWWFWWMRGYLREGKEWADRCLRSPGLARNTRGRVLAARAVLGIWSREYDLAVTAFGEARKIADEAGDTRSLAYSDIGCGLVCALTRSMGDGTEMIRRGIAAFDASGDETGAITGLAAISWVRAIKRDFGESDAVLLETLERARQNGSDVDMGIAESALAQFRISRDETAGVIDLLASSLEHLAAAKHIGSTILTLDVIAELGLHGGATRESVAILAATEAIRSSTGTAVPPEAAARREVLLNLGRGCLGGGFHDAWELGAKMGFGRAVDQGRVVLRKLRAGSETSVP